jgi:hypothetical protein
LTSVLDGGEWSASRPGRFIPRERTPGTHWIGSWVGPTAVLDTVVKRKIPSPRRESNPRSPIVQPVAQLYTDWAVTALTGILDDPKIRVSLGRSTTDLFGMTTLNAFCISVGVSAFAVKGSYQREASQGNKERLKHRGQEVDSNSRLRWSSIPRPCVRRLRGRRHRQAGNGIVNFEDQERCVTISNLSRLKQSSNRFLHAHCRVSLYINAPKCTCNMSRSTINV